MPVPSSQDLERPRPSRTRAAPLPLQPRTAILRPSPGPSLRGRRLHRRAARRVSGVYGALLWICLMDMDVFSICCKVGRRARAADPTCPTSTYASGCIVRATLIYPHSMRTLLNNRASCREDVQLAVKLWFQLLFDASELMNTTWGRIVWSDRCYTARINRFNKISAQLWQRSRVLCSLAMVSYISLTIWCNSRLKYCCCANLMSSSKGTRPPDRATCVSPLWAVYIIVCSEFGVILSWPYLLIIHGSVPDAFLWLSGAKHVSPLQSILCFMPVR